MISETDNRDEVFSAARASLPPSIVELIEKYLREPYPESQLISVLHKVQEHYGYLARKQMDAVAQLMHVPASVVSGVATFYHFFRLQPPGKYSIHVCLGTACYVKGADRIVDRLKQELGIDIGETTKDGLFSLDASRCFGTCGLAPVIMIGGDTYGQVTPDKIPALLEKYAQAEAANP
ncbi:MAG: NADH-quinone oxidoreductase subunit NuoE [Candidatus Latescibacterota bacterium]